MQRKKDLFDQSTTLPVATNTSTTTNVILRTQLQPNEQPKAKVKRLLRTQSALNLSETAKERETPVMSHAERNGFYAVSKIVTTFPVRPRDPLRRASSDSRVRPALPDDNEPVATNTDIREPKSTSQVPCRSTSCNSLSSIKEEDSSDDEVSTPLLSPTSSATTTQSSSTLENASSTSTNMSTTTAFSPR